MKAKQWVKDYVDFAMPLVMAVVALNLVDLLIDLPYAYKPERYTPKISDFFTIKAHLNVFMQQVDKGRLFFFLGFALFLRLFTDRIKVNMLYSFAIIWLYSMLCVFIDNSIKKESLEMVAYIFIDGLFIIFATSLLSFSVLKILFKNFSIIKKISYIAISILILLTLLIYQFELTNALLIAKWILLITILVLIIISIPCLLILELFYTLTIPQDIKDFAIEMEQDKIAREIAEKERQERNRIINDIANAVRRKL